jgi:chloramphenicol-sensitive protein RarD
LISGKSAGGPLAIFLTYVLWGAMPIYWRAMASVDPLEILAHRAVWSCVFSIVLLAATRKGSEALSLLRSRRALPRLALSGTIITVNWYMYIWAVNSGRILETSLGYFINPAVSILFGVIIFRERLGKVQWLAMGIAFCGVCVEVAELGRVPVVSLGLAVTFGLYGLLKKTFAVDSIAGLAIETALIAPFALLWLAWRQSIGAARFPYPLGVDLLLAGAGALTAFPLVVFAWGVGKTKMTILGLIQYTSPVMTFLTATLIYREPISTGRMFSFSLIWAGIIIFTAESLLASKRGKQSPSGDSG